MLSWFKKFLWDETVFVRLARGAALGLGAMVMTGGVELPQWVAAVSMFLGGMMGAGDKNKPEK